MSIIRTFAAAAIVVLLPVASWAGDSWERLIGPVAASNMISEKQVRVVDIRHRELGFQRGHVPGSVSMPLWSWRGHAGISGRPPSSRKLTRMVRAAGLETSDSILLVHSGLDEMSFASAAWVYWVMKSAGFSDIYILDGGIRAWKNEGYAVTRIARNFRRTNTVVHFSDRWLATTAEVARISEGSAYGTLLDARAQKVEPGSSIAGATSYAMTRLMGSERTHALSPLETLIRLKELDANWESESVISFCNNGLQGAATWFMASEVAGIDNVRLYSESLEGWNALASN